MTARGIALEAGARRDAAPVDDATETDGPTTGSPEHAGFELPVWLTLVAVGAWVEARRKRRGG